MITLTDVWLTLGERQVLKEISLDVPAGETRVILGGSGSGKTTILRVILGLFRPDRGKILIDGQDITAMRERDLTEIRQRMAMVFQGSALFDSLTVRENVGYRLWEQGRLSDAIIEKSVHDSLQFVGLEQAIDKMPAELSGGMKKRVGIARALASGARIILYDEPTAGLDPINTCTISRLIELLKSKGVTQVVVTHDLATAYRIADRIIMIHKGRRIFEGNPEELTRSADPDIRAFLFPDGQCFDADAFAASEIGGPE